MKNTLAAVLLALSLSATLTFTPAQSVKPAHKPLPVAQASAQNAKASWFLLGDTGSAMSGQFEVAARMTEVASKKPVNAMIIAGDVVYENGDVAKLGEARFKKPYQPLRQKGVEVWTALGNHDIDSGHGEEAMKFYGMPSRYYTKTLGQLPNTQPERRPLVDFFVIDSNTFNNDAVQQAWLKKALADSHSRWKFVVGHHPIYSSGKHGLNQGLQKTLQPVLEKYKVTAYVAGHDHDYERFQAKNGVAYFVTGGGGAVVREAKKIEPGSLKFKAAYHFLYFTATPKQVSMEAIDKNGVKFDSVVLK